MKNYFTRLWAYHQRFFRLYLLVLVAVYGVYLLHLPTPLSLILRPFGLKAWSAGLTRASVRLLHLDWQGAWDYNPLIYPLVVYILTYFFLFPIFSDKKIKGNKVKTPVPLSLQFPYTIDIIVIINIFIIKISGGYTHEATRLDRFFPSS